MNAKPIIPVILCGGSGSRLWPLSRESYPKQYLTISSEENLSLLQQTQLRIKNLKNIHNPIIVCNEEHRFIVAEQMRQINANLGSILLEPFGRNTAPAITCAAFKSLEVDKDPILLVLSSDHKIENSLKFVETIELALKYVHKKELLTFGVVPTSPEIGYGYIKSEFPFDPKDLRANKITKFIEKPNLSNAKEYLHDRRYTWNSGIFLFKAKNILEEIKKLNPDIFNNCKESILKTKTDLYFDRLDSESFGKCQNIAVDVAVMEKTKNGFVFPLDVGWNDLGSWNAVWETSKKDKRGNLIQGNVFNKKLENCYVRSENRLVVGIGLNDLMIIETSDAVLVANKKESQEVKNIVQELKSKGIKEGQSHKKVFRPWGNYLSVVEEDCWQVKLITVNPGEKLSLQLHHHRSEHWVVVKGTALVRIKNKKTILKENQSTFIPLGTKHQLSNPGRTTLRVIEVQSGTYLGEDDIVRFEDKYGRY